MSGNHGKFASAVNVEGINRPVRIAYFVPFCNSTRSHEIIDNVFAESYSRWGGNYTLIVPVKSNGFLIDKYSEWLNIYDPDYIYTFEHLTNKFKKEVHLSCNPIYFGTIDEIRTRENPKRVSFDLSHADQFVSSLSTVTCPEALHRGVGRRYKDGIPTILTHFPGILENTFIKNNFGLGLYLNKITYPIEGLYNTLCFTSGEAPKNHTTGTFEVETIIDLIGQLVEHKVVPASKLSTIEAKCPYNLENYKVSNSFNIFVGNSVLDRINYWASKHFSYDYFNNAVSLIIEQENFENEDFLKQLGRYLNAFNSCRRGNQTQVRLFSQSVEKNKLKDIATDIRQFSHGLVDVSGGYNSFVIPEESDFKYYSSREEEVLYKAFEKKNTFQLEYPYHFNYIPSRFHGVKKGDWVFEFNIERHNDHSIYSNIVDRWWPATRYNSLYPFTDNTGRITSANQFAVISKSNQDLRMIDSARRSKYLTVSLPEDYDYFSYLTYPLGVYRQDDCRNMFIKPIFDKIEISDKGQNLRGVVSMFDSLHVAYCCLCNDLWKNVIRHEKTTFSLKQLEGFLPSTRTEREIIAERYKLNYREIDKFLKYHILDNIEYFVGIDVIKQFYEWRCDFCGRINARTVDDLKRDNSCDICKENHTIPIDIEWTFQISQFVKESLDTRNGLSVLWALGYLQCYYTVFLTDKYGLHKNSFYYLPEVNLYHKSSGIEVRNEIDALCMIKGKYHAVEVKRNVYGFVFKDREIAKYIDIIKRLEPDVAVLMFESYSENPEDTDLTKNKLAEVIHKIEHCMERDLDVVTIIESELPSKLRFPDDFAMIGPRASYLR